MTDGIDGDPPLMQRLYNRIWLIALAAILFWALSYVAWGTVDIFSVPSGMIVPASDLTGVIG